MPRTHTYTAKKGYEGTPLFEKDVTWTAPTSIAEALKPGPDTNGQPYFADEATLVAAAVNQLNILKGHTIQKGTKPSKSKDDAGNEVTVAPTVKSVADAERVGRETVMRPSTRKRGENVKAVATKAREVSSKVSQGLPTFSADKIAFLVELGQLSQADADAEMARRAAEKGAGRKG